MEVDIVGGQMGGMGYPSVGTINIITCRMLDFFDSPFFGAKSKLITSADDGREVDTVVTFVH